MKNIFLLSLLLFGTSLVFASGVKSTKAEKWVVERKININDKPAAFDVNKGSYLVLYDNQVNVSEQKDYYHIIRELINETGVQNNSQIEIQFDPTFQKISIHHIRIIRDNKPMDILNPNEFKIIKQETDLSRYLYNGINTALYILNDVRVGDFIEYDYTISGFNPVFNEKYSSDFYFQGSEPSGFIFYSVLIPGNRKLNFKTFNDAPAPVISNLPGEITNYEWAGKESDAKYSEDYAPDWFDDFKRVQISEMNSFSEIVDWALSINPAMGIRSTEMNKLIEDFKKPNQDKYDYIKKCIRFVQDDVRYMGIELNAYSCKPHTPIQTFQQRYGDCKDKSILLCSMLQAIGIEAYPVYVNTYKGSHLNDMLPAPGNFNHCVCMYKVDDRKMFVDPTLSLQRGAILKQYFPDYGKGLILRKGETELTEFSGSEAGSMVVHEKYKLKEVGEEGYLIVKTKYTGSRADGFRNDLQSSSLKGVEKSFRDYYSSLYDSLEVYENLTIDDNEAENIINIRESYKLKHPWEEIKNGENNYIFSVEAKILKDNLVILPQKERGAPVNITHPYNLDFTIEVETPEAWNVNEDEKTIENKYFHFSYSSILQSKGFLLNYKYNSLGDVVPVEDLRSYNSDMDSLTAQLNYQITWNKNLSTENSESNFRLNISFLIIAIFFSISLCLIGLRVYRMNVDLPAQIIHRPIGGIMILPLIGLVFSSFRIIYQLFTDNYFNEFYFTQLKNSVISNGAFVEAILIFEICGNLILVGLGILCFISFIKRRNLLPRMIVSYYILNLIILVCDQFMVEKLNIGSAIEAKEIYRSLFVSLIWVPFFLLSQRVKETFVVPYGENLNNIIVEANQPEYSIEKDEIKKDSEI